MPRLADGPLTSLHAAAAREYHVAAADAGVVEHQLRFGARRLRLRCAGAGPADVLLGALARRFDEEGGEVHATISLWRSGRLP